MRQMRMFAEGGDDVSVLLDGIAGYGAATLSAPASAADLQLCSELLGHPLPPALAELLRESDGIVGEYDLGLLWPASRIGQDNRHFRPRGISADGSGAYCFEHQHRSAPSRRSRPARFLPCRIALLEIPRGR